MCKQVDETNIRGEKQNKYNWQAVLGGDEREGGSTAGVPAPAGQ